ncbi:DNA translocase FtsK [Paenibacillus sp. CC-CFT747]|nr:DNA translocase FtsK [Paenibacillus sp. CC-CFT747]
MQNNPQLDNEWVDAINAIVDGTCEVTINLLLIETAFDQNIEFTERTEAPQGSDLKPVEALPITRIRFGERDIQRSLVGYLEPLITEKAKQTSQENANDITTEVLAQQQAAATAEPPFELANDSIEGEEQDLDNQESRNPRLTSLVSNDTTAMTDLQLGFEPSTSERTVIDDTAKNIYRVLSDIGMRLAEPVDTNKADIGPSIVRYKIRLQTGERVSTLQSRARDLMRELATEKEPIIDNLPNTNYVHIDLARPEKQSPKLLPLLSHLRKPPGTGLYCPLGVTPDGRIEMEDVTKYPHMLVAGSTNSGKTMFLYSLIVGLTQIYTPEELQLVLIDPKQTDFVFFNTLPHLRGARYY